MVNGQQAVAGSQEAVGEKRPFRGTMTPELVRQVADKVYAMWLRDLQIERERARTERRFPDSWDW